MEPTGHENKNDDLQECLNGVIIGHRDIINQRYDYDRLKKNYELPSFFNQKQSDELKGFFLDEIYPEVKKRTELEEAFVHLDQFIKSPNKIFALIRDSMFIMFKYGRHLPNILGAALKAMKSFRSATRIEEKMALTALRTGVKPPFSQRQMTELLTKLPDHMLENHQQSIWPLYDVLKNKNLVNKILEVVDQLLKKMQEKTAIYSENEISGVQLGRDLIKRATELFGNYSDQELDELVRFVTMVEKDAYSKFMSSN